MNYLLSLHSKLGSHEKTIVFATESGGLLP